MTTSTTASKPAAKTTKKAAAKPATKPATPPRGADDYADQAAAAKLSSDEAAAKALADARQLVAEADGDGTDQARADSYQLPTGQPTPAPAVAHDPDPHNVTDHPAKDEHGAPMDVYPR